MSIWKNIADALSALASGEGLLAIFDSLRAKNMLAPNRSVAFTISVIALGAKMAKADGEVTRDEISAFRQIFTLAEHEQNNAARVFNLARQDVAGFESYAQKIAALFANEPRVLTDVLEGLFYISMSDGHYHPAEDEFLREVALIFGLGDRCFRALRARHVSGAPQDPFDILGLHSEASLPEARAAWKAAVRDSHPDRLIARGVPPEAVKLGERRLIAVNSAWLIIQSYYKKAN
ncbi:MAG: DnaJ like chaperone protein [Paracoccaceae bacterium]|jgi:DnaJ like chaperone protein